MDPKVFDDTVAELHAFIEDDTERARLILDEIPRSYSIRGSDRSFTKGWETGFRRCLAELQRLSQKEEDKFEVIFGNAGFVVVYKNGERLKKFNTKLTFEKRKNGGIISSQVG